MVYWRVRSTRQVEVPDPAKRDYGPWSETGFFYTDFEGQGRLPASRPAGQAGTPQALPRTGRVSTPTPISGRRWSWPRGYRVLPRVDRLPTFDGEFLQRSGPAPALRGA